MATHPISCFGVPPKPAMIPDVEAETNPQLFWELYMTRYTTPSPKEQRKPSGPPSSFMFEVQRGTIRPLPFLVTKIQNQIEMLYTSEEVDVRPTNYAYNEAKRVVVSAYVAVSPKEHGQKPPRVPLAIIGTDELGGILFSWTSGNKYVAAKFAATPAGRSFLYREEGAEHRAEELTEQALASRLTWLSEQ